MSEHYEVIELDVPNYGLVLPTYEVYEIYTMTRVSREFYVKSNALAYAALLNQEWSRV